MKQVQRRKWRRKVNLKLRKRVVDLAPIWSVHLQREKEEESTFDPLSETESGECENEGFALLTLLFQGFKNSRGGRTKFLSPTLPPHLLLLLIHLSTVTVLTLLLSNQILYFQFNATTLYIFLFV